MAVRRHALGEAFDAVAQREADWQALDGIVGDLTRVCSPAPEIGADDEVVLTAEQWHVLARDALRCIHSSRHGDRILALRREVGTGGGPDEDPSEIGAVEPTFEVFDARDPFEQLVSDDVGSDEVGTTQPVSDTTPTDGATPVDGSTLTSTAPGAPGGTSSVATVGSTTILLDDVYRSDGVRTALVVVDGQGFDATTGDTVADKVTVLDIAGNCATMRLGDKRFILCEGEQITK